MYFNTYSIRVLLILLIFGQFSCQPDSEYQGSGLPIDDSTPLFRQLPSTHTNIDFNNAIVEDENFNHVLQDVIFNGGGVAVVDINNDGLQDLFFFRKHDFRSSLSE